MSKLQPQDVQARSAIDFFCHCVFRLRVIHRMQDELFGDAEDRSLAEKVAPYFFSDLQGILIEYFLLEIGKLTDPATSASGKYENLSVANFIERIDWPSDCGEKLSKLNEVVRNFRDFIAPARNKRFAHNDKETILSGSTLGRFPDGEDVRLLDSLESMCNIMYEAAFGTVLGWMVPCQPGDVNDLKQALRRALAFDHLLSTSIGDERRRFLKALDSISFSSLKPQLQPSEMPPLK